MTSGRRRTAPEIEADVMAMHRTGATQASIVAQMARRGSPVSVGSVCNIIKRCGGATLGTNNLRGTQHDPRFPETVEAAVAAPADAPAGDGGALDALIASCQRELEQAQFDDDTKATAMWSRQLLEALKQRARVVAPEAPKLEQMPDIRELAAEARKMVAEYAVRLAPK